jgi:hypothetical protein
MVSSNAKAGSQKSTPSGSKYRVPAASFTSLEITSPDRLAGAKSSACELAHNRDSFIPTCRGLTSAPFSTQHHPRFKPDPFALRWFACCKNAPLALENKTGRGRTSALFRLFGFPKFLVKIFGRHQQPDDGGDNSAPPSCFSAPLQNTLDDLRADDDQRGWCRDDEVGKGARDQNRNIK